MFVMNTVEDGSILDIPMAADYSKAVYALYRAGVYTGGDKGAFFVNSVVIRSQVAAVFGRMANVPLRKAVTLQSSAVKPDSKAFPDVSFRTYASAFDKDKNGKLSKSEISVVKEINATHRNITSLKGIEGFTSLNYLN